jgi:hypothetical protein
MTTEIATGRGTYRLVAAAPLEWSDASVILTLALERADGIERVVTRCRVARELITGPLTDQALVERLKGWVAREFEAVRESALKAIRSERRLYEIRFDLTNRGPF